MKMEQLVAEFQTKHGFAVGESLLGDKHSDPQASIELISAANQLEKLTGMVKGPAMFHLEKGDERLYRLYLIAEELTEVVEAMASNDELELADGLGDLTYVVSGTATTFNIPLQEVFEEVHRSNMTKMKRDPEKNSRMRDKGPDYESPRIQEILDSRGEDQIWYGTPRWFGSIHDLLMLVADEFPAEINLATVMSLKPEVAQECRDWAEAVCLTASDNEVEIPPMPLILGTV